MTETNYQKNVEIPAREVRADIVIVDPGLKDIVDAVKKENMIFDPPLKGGMHRINVATEIYDAKYLIGLTKEFDVLVILEDDDTPMAREAEAAETSEGLEYDPDSLIVIKYDRDRNEALATLQNPSREIIDMGVNGWLKIARSQGQDVARGWARELDKWVSRLVEVTGKELAEHNPEDKNWILNAKKTAFNPVVLVRDVFNGFLDRLTIRSPAIAGDEALLKGTKEWLELFPKLQESSSDPDFRWLNDDLVSKAANVSANLTAAAAMWREASETAAPASMLELWKHFAERAKEATTAIFSSPVFIPVPAMAEGKGETEKNPETFSFKIGDSKFLGLYGPDEGKFTIVLSLQKGGRPEDAKLFVIQLYAKGKDAPFRELTVDPEIIAKGAWAASVKLPEDLTPEDNKYGIEIKVIKQQRPS